MNYLAVIRALLSGWWIIAGATLLGAGASLVVTSITPPTYEASTSYYVSVAGDMSATAGEIAQGSTAAQQKIKSYMQLATSPRVLQGVIDELDLDTSPSALASQVTTSVDAGTVIIRIAVQDGSATSASTIAEQIGKSLATVVQQIEPTGADQKPSVVLEEVTPATEPANPIAPRKSADLALGLVGGLAAGAALALLRAALDTRVRSGEDLDVDVPVVGDIAFDTDAARRPLIIRDEANSARSEAFRSLRTNIQFLRTGGAPTIAVTSARPAEGKTTTTANLGIALSKSGVRTVIIDADLRRPNVAAVMSVEGAVGLTDLLVGRAELEDVVQPWGIDGLAVLPAGTIPPNPSELIGSEAMARVLAELASRFDVVLVDTPPVLAVTDSALVSTLVSTTLLVTAANQTKRSDVRLAIEALDRVGQQPAGIVLTKTKHKASRSAYYRSEYTSTRTA
ncbi:polysaccharide biosynthesis tyrosine autokinase [Curtobacterium sp. VKM Ac-1376]|uniref:polysaccharide biosynthesis tyrosine autokinase n=1 Tax=Curtobacterium sp. VKM Ac-1376 TaxID=123312 RepID=UPI00188A451E|nr:polysaccharide biosynthesis tyrosine autokinase [Curtobacterium sp. VKM Ac-1376]MBF4614053.1 polysaccharide biosynthesis tyrosine autokinase [Curtobacterium sp. VKM Ac-1376]